MKRKREERVDNIDLANCLILLSHPKETKPKKHFGPVEFECTTCKRKFSSFQALGGHRASHNKPKLDATKLKLEAQNLSLFNKSKMHGCYICGKEFSLGQALGGHMRRHRIGVNEELSLMKEIKTIGEVPILKRSNSKRVMCLDLNLTPLQNDLKLLFGNMAPKVDSFV
ncbi:unnamed protein product [Vicia faba]|uniref:C2H2-type domain-containing protein n=1 Tax=Vicia faba TaxID=3906 RepID=A0AAV0ZWD4_VICFA|nr:unnamed protein product [Vicia faba]